MQRMRTWRQRVHRTTPVALLAILLQTGNALAMTVPASGSFAYDLYDIGVNQILLGPVGFTGGVACMCVAAILAIRQMILPAAGVVLGGAFLLRAKRQMGRRAHFEILPQVPPVPLATLPGAVVRDG